MTGQAALPGLGCEADARALETDTAERSDDPTPRGVIRAVLEAAICMDIEDGPCVGVDRGRDSHGERESGRALGDPFQWEHLPVRVLDVCAGYGAWASELRRLAGAQGWPVHITGVEIFEARRPELRKWCDGTAIEDWARWLASTGSQYDLVIGNPAFPLILRDNDGEQLPADETMVPTLLAHAPAVLLLHQEQSFTKSKLGREVWRRYPPAAGWLIGPAGFRGDGKADSRCYIATLWLRGHEGPCVTHLLPELDAEARRWRVPPGSEEPSEDLPAAPGWTS